MIAILLSPLYIAVMVLLCLKSIRWVKSFGKVFKKKPFVIATIAVYVILGLLLPVAFLWPKGNQAKRILNVLADYWFGIILYLLLSCVLMFIFRLIVLKCKKFDIEFWMKDKVYAICGLVVVLMTTVMCAFAIRSAHTVVKTEYTIKVNKSAGELKNLKLVLLADLHMGYNVGPEHIEKMVEKVNEINADIIVIAGDIFDNDYDSMENPEKLIELLASMKSKYGTYATYGNHDINEDIFCGFTFGGKENKESDPRMDDFLKRSNIKLMRDEYELIDNSFYLISRPDYEKPGRGVTERKNGKEITAELDKSYPIIVMDHEPREQQELADAGVDVFLNGHTHDGQTFPANILMNILWDNSYGYKKYGSMHNIVTSGVGYFGPIMRLGTLCEVCEINIEFN